MTGLYEILSQQIKKEITYTS